MIRSDKQHIKNENIQNRIILYLIDNNIYLFIYRLLEII